MRVRLAGQPAYTLAYCDLELHESVLVEARAMAAMSDGIETSAGIGPGGVVKATLRRTVGSETFFMGRYRATVADAWVAVAPKYPGDIAVVDLAATGPVLIESGALLAATDRVAIDVRWGGLRNLVLREGATMLRVHGAGLVLIGSYGAIQRFDLRSGERVVVDTGHLVAFSDTARVQVGVLGSLSASVFTGEGLVASVTGPGSVWMQSRAEAALRNWLFPARAQNTGPV